jgi:hypothetical protein
MIVKIPKCIFCKEEMVAGEGMCLYICSKCKVECFYHYNEHLYIKVYSKSILEINNEFYSFRVSRLYNQPWQLFVCLYDNKNNIYPKNLYKFSEMKRVGVRALRKLFDEAERIVKLRLFI